MIDESNNYSNLDSKFFILIIALITLIAGIFFILQINDNHQQEILDIKSEINSTENSLLKKQEQQHESRPERPVQHPAAPETVRMSLENRKANTIE